MAGSLRSFLSKFGTKSKEIEDELFNGPNSLLSEDKHCFDPNKAWSIRKRNQSRKEIKVVNPNKPCKKGHVRFVCISDTHTIVEKAAMHGKPVMDIPDGDVLLHTGDFTMYGTPDEVALFNDYLGTLPHKYKIVIAGNHDMTFDLDLIDRVRATRIWRLNEENYDSKLKAKGVKTVHELLTNCIYLQDSMVKVHGINIYGAPWQPGSGGWGFNCKRGSPLLTKWNRIPDDTDILLTHGPPCGYGDDVGCSIIKTVFDPRSSKTANHVGCVDLLNTIQKRVKPKYHVFGHIHEGYGMTTDGTTTFVNASTCDEDYKPINPPIVFDLPIMQTQSSKATRCSQSEIEWLIRTELPKTFDSFDDTICFEDGALDEDSSSDDSTSGDSSSDDNVCFADDDDDDDKDSDMLDSNKLANNMSEVFQDLDNDKPSGRTSKEITNDLSKIHTIHVDDIVDFKNTNDEDILGSDKSVNMLSEVHVRENSVGFKDESISDVDQIVNTVNDVHITNSDDNVSLNDNPDICVCVNAEQDRDNVSESESRKCVT